LPVGTIFPFPYPRVIGLVPPKRYRSYSGFFRHV
jgi:hypothetical protein